MIEPDCLNPKEVLSHLNALGYHDVTPQQLKEFLHDLKKLIKYDQKRNSQRCDQCFDSHLNSCDCECSCVHSDENAEKLSSNESYASSYSEFSTSEACLSESNIKLEDELGRQNFFSRNGLDKDSLQRAQSSFIRPWNLQVYKENINKDKKKDPVRLYHQYKDSWSRFKFPGQSNHSQLRWLIRNKMLGQEPQPRVLL